MNIGGVALAFEIENVIDVKGTNCSVLELRIFDHFRVIVLLINVHLGHVTQFGKNRNLKCLTTTDYYSNIGQKNQSVKDEM